MKPYRFFIILSLFVAGLYISCEKEDNLIAPMDENLIAGNYAQQADELLALLTPAERELFSPEDIAAFRQGPEPMAMYEEHTSLRTNLKWQPVLALFYCNTDDGIVTGTGPWYATRHNASILIAQDINAYGRFADGMVTITDHEGYRLEMRFKVYPQYKADNGIRQTLRATIVNRGTGIFAGAAGNLDLNALIRPGHGYPVVILAKGWVCYEREI